MYKIIRNTSLNCKNHVIIANDSVPYFVHKKDIRHVFDENVLFIQNAESRKIIKNKKIKNNKKDDQSILFNPFWMVHVLNSSYKKSNILDIIRKNSDSSIKNKKKNIINKKKSVFLELTRFLKKLKLKNNRNISHHIEESKKINFLKFIHLTDKNQKNCINLQKNHKKYAYPIDMFMIRKNKNSEKCNINNFLASNKINLMNISNINIDSFKRLNRKESFQLNKNETFLFNSKNSIKWRKIIFQKILLSISQKKCTAEINLTQEDLGYIKVKIGIDNNKTSLNFTTENDDVKFFLNHSILFLRNSFMKHGIPLETIQITSLYEKKFYKFLKNVIKKKQSFNTLYNQYTNIKKYQVIDTYV